MVAKKIMCKIKILLFFCFFFNNSDGLHLKSEGNAVVHQEVVRVLKEAWVSPEQMPYDFPHQSVIDGKHPEKAFQLQCPAEF